MDEMGDVDPIEPVIPFEVDRRTEAFALHLEPDLAKPLGRHLALFALAMNLEFEIVEGGLAHHRVQHVLDLPRQHDAPAGNVGLIGEQRPKRQHLAEYGCGLGQGQRRIRQQMSPGRGENLVDAVAEFMRERHDVARLALVVEQDIGMRARHRGMGKGARFLARADPGVDPAAIEEFPRRRFHLGREGPIRAEHLIARLVPRGLPVVVLGQGRVAVPISEPLDAEPAGLERVVAVRKLRVGTLDRRDQGVHHLVLDEIGKVARRGRARKFAPTVLDLLVLGQGVGDQGEDRRVFAQHLAERERRRFAHLGVAVGKQMQDLGAGEVLAVDREAQPRHGLVEQPHPRRPARHRLLAQDLLEILVQLVGTEDPDVPDPRRVTVQPLRLQLVRDLPVFDKVDLEGKEHEIGGDLGDPLLEGLVEPGDLGVRDVAGIYQLGVAHQARERLVDVLVFGDGFAQRIAVEARDLAVVAVLERLGPILRRGEVAFQRRRFRSGVEVAKVPFRQRGTGGIAARGFGAGGFGLSGKFRVGHGLLLRSTGGICVFSERWKTPWERIAVLGGQD